MRTLIKNKLKQYLINKLVILDLEKSLIRSKELGFSPQTIFDVGAYKGDFAKTCLSIWPKANIVCFEPLESKVRILKSWSEKESRVKVIQGLLGSKDVENVKFNMNETASSVLDERDSTNFEVAHLPMRKLDTCIEEFKLNPPNLLKIDTQGYEFQILEGILKNLMHVEVVIAELNHIDIHKDVKLAEEVIHLLYLNGFTIYDFVELHRRPLDNVIWQTDIMFVKKDSILRSNKKWG